MTLLINRKHWTRIAALAGVMFAIGVIAIFPQPVEALNALGTLIATLVSWIVSFVVWVLGLLIAVVIDILIQFAAYNEFINAPAVTIGWLVLRDVANMIVVVLLLVIAVSTILSVEEYQYKKMLPRLLIMAVMVNFSKTIVGFLIDASQVVMLTFVAAFREAGAGNFVAALNLEKMLSINPDYTGDAGLLEVLGGLFLALILMVVALIVLLVMTVIIGFRIVMLWILTVLSPLVFILSAVEAGKEYYAKWWKQLTNYLIVGPVLAFFIWLTLASTGGTPGSDSRAVQTFMKDGGKVSYFATAEEQKFITAAGHWQNLMGFLIAISMLIGGLMITEELGVVGSGFARSALDGMKHTGQSILKNAGKGMMGVGAWAARKAKAGKMGSWLKGIELNPANMYRNIKHGLEERKKDEENRGRIYAGGRLEAGGIKGALLGLGSDAWVEHYAEGWLGSKGIARALSPTLHGTTEQWNKQADTMGAEATKEEKVAADAKELLSKIDPQKTRLMNNEIGNMRLEIQKLENIINTTPAGTTKNRMAAQRLQRLQPRLTQLEAERDAAADLERRQPELEQRATGAIARAEELREQEKEFKSNAEAVAMARPQDLKARAMQRAETQEAMKKYATSNEDELIAMLRSSMQRGEPFEAAGVALKAFSVGHGNEMVQSVRLTQKDIDEHQQDWFTADDGSRRLHPDGREYRAGDRLSTDVDGLSVFVNKVFVDQLGMGKQQAYALQNDLSAAAEGLQSKWYDLAQSIGASADGTLKQYSRAQHELRMSIEKDKGDLEDFGRRGGRGAWGSEMYIDPQDENSGRIVFLDPHALKSISDNFGKIADRFLKQGRLNPSAAANIVANPANMRMLEELGRQLKAAGRDTQMSGGTSFSFDQFLKMFKDYAAASLAEQGKIAKGLTSQTRRSLEQLSRVRAKGIGP